MIAGLTYGNGITTSLSYDPLYRLTQQTTTTGNNSRTINYTYSGDGNLYRREDSQGETVTYNYDNLNRLAGLRKTNGDTCNLVTSSKYDNCNRITRYDYQVPGLFSGYEGFYYRTSTNSSGPIGSLESMSLFSLSWIDYSYDHLQRLHSRRVGMILQESYNYATSSDSGTPLSTSQIQAKAIRDVNNTNNALHRWEYSYDRAGNILNETNTLTNQSTTYTYDYQNQLTQVVTPNKTYQYSYDNAGNILSSNIGGTSHSYTYGNSQWRDLLTKYDGHSITYDSIGNPLSYYNGSSYSFTWTEGRRLQNATKGSSSTSYAYDADGLRTRKTNSDGSYIDYYWADGMLLAERKCNASGTQQYVIKFLYDESCLPVGMSYHSGASNDWWSNYYYAKNLQGDIVGLYFSNYINETTYQQSLVATYEYDPWGNVTVKNSAGTVNTSASFIGNINPLRFKGYYYDRETGFYYVSSRYYDPEIGRWINADIPETLTADFENFAQYNLFAYCFNNPVNMSDETGTWPSWAKKVVAAVAVVAVVAAVAAVTVATAGAGTAAAVIAVGAAKGAAIGMASGAAIGAATGAVSHRVSTGSWSGAGTAALNGMGDGALSGAVTGAITGAAGSAVKVSQAAKAWDSGTFKSGYQSMKYHYNKHVVSEGLTKGNNVLKYTQDAVRFANRNSSVLKYTYNYNYGNASWNLTYSTGQGGMFTSAGKILTFWYR